MKEELVRLRHVFLTVHDNELLYGLSLRVGKGEILGVYGTSSAGRAALAELLTGRTVPDRGFLFVEGACEESWNRDFARMPGTASVEARPDAIPLLSVWENLLMLRPAGPGFVFRRGSGAMVRYIRDFVRQYDEHIDAGVTLAQLSPVERYIVSILKTRLMGKSLVVLEDSLPNLSREDARRLRALLVKLSEEGMTFVITSCYYSALEDLCERVVTLSDGRIIRESFPETAGMESETFPEPFTARPRPTDWKRMGLFLLNLENGERLEVCFAEHRRTVIFDLSGRVSRAMDILRRGPGGLESGLRPERELERRYAGSGRRLFAEFSSYGYLARNLPLTENLCLGLYRRVSRGPFVSRRRVRYLTREFNEWYGSDRLALKERCGELLHSEQLAVTAYKIRLVRPAMAVFLDSGSGRESTAHRQAEQELDRLLSEGSSVLVVTSGMEYRAEKADEYIVVTENEILYHVSYEELACRYGWGGHSKSSRDAAERNSYVE